MKLILFQSLCSHLCLCLLQNMQLPMVFCQPAPSSNCRYVLIQISPAYMLSGLQTCAPINLLSVNNLFLFQQYLNFKILIFAFIYFFIATSLLSTVTNKILIYFSALHCRPHVNPIHHTTIYVPAPLMVHLT